MAVLDLAEREVAWDLVDGVDARVVELGALVRAEVVQALDGVRGRGVCAAPEERAVVGRGAVGARLDVGERAFEHPQLGACFGGDAAAVLPDGGGDISACEEWALVGVTVLGVEVHELDACDGEARLFDDVGLDCGVGEVLRLHTAARLDLGDDPGAALFGEGVDGDEDVVFEERRFEDGGVAAREGLSRARDGLLGVAVVELDECGVRELLAGAVADSLAGVEAGLEGWVGGELGGLGVVDLPPELAVALEARGEAGFGEAVGQSSLKVSDRRGKRP